MCQDHLNPVRHFCISHYFRRPNYTILLYLIITLLLYNFNTFLQNCYDQITQLHLLDGCLLLSLCTLHHKCYTAAHFWVNYTVNLCQTQCYHIHMKLLVFPNSYHIFVHNCTDLVLNNLHVLHLVFIGPHYWLVDFHCGIDFPNKRTCSLVTKCPCKVNNTVMKENERLTIY